LAAKLGLPDGIIDSESFLAALTHRRE
jgi:hypothetical protein